VGDAQPHSLLSIATTCAQTSSSFLNHIKGSRKTIDTDIDTATLALRQDFLPKKKKKSQPPLFTEQSFRKKKGFSHAHS